MLALRIDLNCTLAVCAPFWGPGENIDLIDELSFHDKSYRTTGIKVDSTGISFSCLEKPKKKKKSFKF